MEKEKQYLPYHFTEDEKKEIGMELAQAVSRHKEAEARLKSVQTQIKGEMTELEGRIDKCAEKVRTGYEMRDIECEVRRDWKLGRIQYWRLDNGEMGKERGMTQEELQMQLEHIG